MTFKIDNIKSIMAKYGLARNNHFAVYIMPPASISNPIINDLPFLTDSVNLPTMSLVTEDVRHRGYGHMEKRPVGSTFEDVSMTILGDSGGHAFKLFEEWQMLIQNYSGERGSTNSGLRNEFFNYPSDYWGTVEIYLYDITSKKYQSYTLHKAYPVTFASQQLSWEANDTVMKLAVGFSYRSFTTTSIDEMTEQQVPEDRLINEQRLRFERFREVIESSSLEKPIYI